MLCSRQAHPSSTSLLNIQCYGDSSVEIAITIAECCQFSRGILRCRHVSTGLRRATGKDLLFSAARSEDGEAFAFKSIGEKKGFGHVGLGCRGGQIDGFRDSAVAISLKY